MLFATGARGVMVLDCIGASVDEVASAHPGVQLAGYSTGSGDVPWSQAQFDAHPGTLRICQDAGATDDTADYLDVEQGAATFADCPGWFARTDRNYQQATRPGQRPPAIYQSASNVTNVVNALVNGGVKSGCGLIVANWSLSEPQALADVLAAAGPFPIVGVQYNDPGPYDVNVFSSDWLAAVSGAPAWRRWGTAGKSSLADVAISTGMLPSSILRHTATHYGAFDPVISTYIDSMATMADNIKIPPGGELWVKG